jgi:hypothetical protein
MVSKFPECDLCPTSACNDEKIEVVLQDADFIKAFVNNMLTSNIDEIAKDCYFMSEVISEKTTLMEIADFAFCIYVQLSQLVEMPIDKRMEIAVLFRQEFDRMGEDVTQGREVAKKKASAPSPAKEAPSAKSATVSFQAKAITAPAPAKQKAALAPVRPPAPVQAKPEPTPTPTKAPVKVRALPEPVKLEVAKPPAPKPAPEPVGDDARKFLDELDQDIADIDEISSKVEKLIQTEGEPEPDASAVPVAPSPAPAAPAGRKSGGLEPVIGKLAAVRPMATGAIQAPAAARAPSKPREPERGSKANPIKLTPEMLAGIVSDKDMARVEKGIKIKRIESSRLAPKVTAPMQMRDGSMSPSTGKPAGMPEKIERIDRPTDKGKALGEELFSAFQQIKAREELPSTFNLETLGVGEHPEGERVEKKATPGSKFISDLFSLSPEKPPAQEEPVSSPVVEKPASRPVVERPTTKSIIENLTLDFGEERPTEAKRQPGPATTAGAGPTKICPSCQKPNPAKNVFCAKCGARF